MSMLRMTEVTAIGGRVGSAASSDGNFWVKFDAPIALGGEGGQGTSPEQLFATGFAAAFLCALRTAAERHQIKIARDSHVTATVVLRDQNDGLGETYAVTLAIDLADLDRTKAEELVSMAHTTCPYSRAVRGNIDVCLQIA